LVSVPIDAEPAVPAPFWSMNVPMRRTLKVPSGNAESIITGSVSSEQAAKMTTNKNKISFFIIDVILFESKLPMSYHKKITKK
jgi:hypothetical protein